MVVLTAECMTPSRGRCLGEQCFGLIALQSCPSTPIVISSNQNKLDSYTFTSFSALCSVSTFLSDLPTSRSISVFSLAPSVSPTSCSLSAFCWPYPTHRYCAPYLHRCLPHPTYRHCTPYLHCCLPHPTHRHRAPYLHYC